VAAVVAVGTATAASRLRGRHPALGVAVAEDAVAYATIAWATRRPATGG
jgi:hypothetical protein